jgi:hypothetical protein
MEDITQPVYEQPKNLLPKAIKVEKILVEWSSPARPYKERSREFYTTVASIAFLLGIILLLLKEFLLIGVIISFAFLSYVLASVKPESVSHQVTTYGIRTDGKLYPWDELTNFWLKKQWTQELVIVKTIKAVPGVIIMVVDAGKREEIVKAIGSKIALEKPEDSFVDRASKWLGDKVPLENG